MGIMNFDYFLNLDENIFCYHVDPISFDEESKVLKESFISF